MCIRDSPKYEAFKVVKAENKSFDRDRYKEFPTTLADLRFLTNERNINHQVVEKFLDVYKRQDYAIHYFRPKKYHS